jgi:hypothetical protein
MAEVSVTAKSTARMAALSQRKKSAPLEPASAGLRLA